MKRPALPLPESCTASDLQDLLGLTSAERIRQLAREGIIIRNSQHGRFLLKESVRGYLAYKATARKNQWDSDGSEAGDDYEAHRARLTKAKADIAEMQAAILKGTVHEAKAVEAVWTDHLVNCRAKLLGMPRRLAARLHSESNPNGIERVLESAIYEALNELAEYDPEIVMQKYLSTAQTTAALADDDDDQPQTK